jgi:hypothetical protein
VATSPYATAAQQGESYGALRFDSKDAESYLSGSEQSAYTAASRGLGLEPKRGKKGNIKSVRKIQSAHDQAATKMQRLRDVASARAFDAYQTATSDYSKPWKLQAGPNGLIKAADVHDTMESDSTRSFGSMDLIAGKRMRDTLNSMKTGNESTIVDPNLIGSSSQRAYNSNLLRALGEGDKSLAGRVASGTQKRVGGSGAAGGAASAARYRRMRTGFSKARTEGDVLDAERVYTGMGGFDIRNRAPDFGY